MNTFNPYQRWRHAVYVGGVAVVGLLTAGVLLTMVGCLFAWFGANSGQAGY